jgi:predicted MFS family arabinose efflux permease
MEIVLTVIGVLAFFGGSYFLGNFLVGFKDDTSQDKLMKGLFGVLVMSLLVILVGLVAAGIHNGVVMLVN